MIHLIDKNKIVAEIERLKTIYNNDENIHHVARYNILVNILSFLNTLEVKDVDLEKEINKYISDNFFGSETMGFFAVRTNEEPNDQDMALCAKHFFELGLKAAQKGE